MDQCRDVNLEGLHNHSKWFEAACMFAILLGVVGILTHQRWAGWALLAFLWACLLDAGAFGLAIHFRGQAKNKTIH